jgi:hypothetical protein
MSAERLYEAHPQNGLLQILIGSDTDSLSSNSEKGPPNGTAS